MRVLTVVIATALLWTGCPPFSCWWVPLELARRDISRTDASYAYLVQVDYVDEDGGIIDGGSGDCETVCNRGPCKDFQDDAGIRWVECQEVQEPACY